MSKKILTLTFLSIALLGILHYAGSFFYFYWSIVWFDNVMHFLGGFSIALLFIWFWYFSGVFGSEVQNTFKFFATTIVFVLLVSIGWEIFEYVFDIANPTGGNYLVDTTQDLIADFFGTILGVFVVFSIKKATHSAAGP